MLSINYAELKNGQLEWILPDLGEAGLKATFFVSGPGLADGITQWRQVLTQGHDIGRATLLELAPFISKMPNDKVLEELDDWAEIANQIAGEGREWVSASVDSQRRFHGITLGSESILCAPLERVVESQDERLAILIDEPNPVAHHALLDWLATQRPRIALVRDMLTPA